MTQSVSSTKIHDVGLNRSLNSAWIHFTTGVAGTPPVVGADGYFGFDLAATFDLKLWTFALAAQMQGLPVLVQGTGSVSVGTSWEGIAYMAYDAPQ